MNEKTKQILRYVAWGVGGLALGIGLLGGLAMCASSGNRSTAEGVNTIITKKNAVSTNPTTGITSYQFSLPNDYSNVGEGEMYTAIYRVDTNFDLALYPDGVSIQSVANYDGLKSALETSYQNAKSTTANELRFMHSTFKYKPYSSAPLQNGEYFSFVLPSASYYAITPLPFLLTNATSPTFARLDEIRSNSNGAFFNLTLERSQLYVYYTSVPTYQPNFQDVPSYYQSQGWEDGYESGDNVGYWAGYNEGIGTASSFTDISGNLNAVYDLTPMGVSSATWQNLHGLTDVTIYNLLQFFDNEQNTWHAYIVDGVSSSQPTGTRTMYVDVAQLSSLDSQTIGRAIYNNASTISLQEVSTAHFEFAQIRNVSNRSLSLNLLLLYGWTNDNTAYQAGYQAGLKDGFEGTNTNNVFSLFTSAFNAVGGFFNLKVFGFLPLYWFFLTPLFVALITLLLRMVKH